jgi:VWFA-related protein
MLNTPTRVRLAASIGLATLTISLTAGARPQTPPPATASQAIAPQLRLEVVAVDKDGRPVDGLRTSDVSVTLDGAARPVVSIRRVSRGPGAGSDAARRMGAAGPGLSFAAEPIRNVMVIVDQSLIVRGEEKTAIQASGALLNRLGIGDLVAVVRLPFSVDQHIELSADRPVAREALALVRGQAARSVLGRADPNAPTLERTGAEEQRAAELEAKTETATAIAPELSVATPEAEFANARDSLAALTGILRSMQQVPGRKVIAVFSPGFQRATSQQLADAAAAAVASNATIYGFGLPSFQDDPRTQPDASALQALARNTGGSYVTLGRNPEKAIEKTMDDLSAVYVATLAPAAGDGDGRRRQVRVQSTLKDVTLRAPAWLVPSPDPQDVVPEPVAAEAPAPADASAPAPAAGTAAKAPAVDAVPAAGTGKDVDLPVALGRLYDYVRAYELQYSALVSEEEFQQVAGQKSLRLRSDFLLVKQEKAEGWVSFRDVFEVNGVPVRDREDRLKKLFLEPGVDATAQLMRIKEESARYNIGPLERNINVPMFMLKFLTPANRSHSRFRIASRSESDGVQTWRIDFTETARPTLIKDRNEKDVPATGYFVVEQSTGAIMETALRLEGQAYIAEMTVKFRLDPGLGMWVPTEMRETYRTPRGSLVTSNVSMGIALEGTAKYSKYRRFQVKTEETVEIKK